MNYKSIREIITEEAWNKMKEEMKEAFTRVAQRMEGAIVEEDELGLNLSCDFVDYYSVPIIHISEIEKHYPFLKRKQVEFKPWLSNPDYRGTSCEVSVSDFEVECRQELSETQEEVVALIKKDLIAIYDELGVEITAYTEELTDEEQEEHGEGYVRIIEVA